MTPHAQVMEALLKRMGLKGTIELLALLCEQKGYDSASDVAATRSWHRDGDLLTAIATVLEN